MLVDAPYTLIVTVRCDIRVHVLHNSFPAACRSTLLITVIFHLGDILLTRRVISSLVNQKRKFAFDKFRHRPLPELSFLVRRYDLQYRSNGRDGEDFLCA